MKKLFPLILFFVSIQITLQADVSDYVESSFDWTPPKIDSVLLNESKAVQINEVLNLSLIFSETIVTKNENKIELPFSLGGKIRKFVFDKKLSGRVLRFKYVVNQGDIDIDGIVLAERLNLKGAKIEDTSGNIAAIQIPPSLRQLSQVKILGEAPKIHIDKIILPLNDKYFLGDRLVFRMQMNSALKTEFNQNNAPFLLLSIGKNLKKAFLYEIDEKDLLFRYKVQDGDEDNDGISIFKHKIIDEFGVLKGEENQKVDLSFEPRKSYQILVSSSIPKLSYVRLNSKKNNLDSHTLEVGDQITLQFLAEDEICSNPFVQIFGIPVNVIQKDKTFNASYKVSANDVGKEFRFNIRYQDASCRKSTNVNQTTLPSSVKVIAKQENVMTQIKTCDCEVKKAEKPKDPVNQPNQVATTKTNSDFYSSFGLGAFYSDIQGKEGNATSGSILAVPISSISLTAKRTTEDYLFNGHYNLRLVAFEATDGFDIDRNFNLNKFGFDALLSISESSQLGLYYGYEDQFYFIFENELIQPEITQSLALGFSFFNKSEIDDYTLETQIRIYKYDDINNSNDIIIDATKSEVLFNLLDDSFGIHFLLSQNTQVSNQFENNQFYSELGFNFGF